jgi:hypothetical protein
LRFFEGKLFCAKRLVQQTILSTSLRTNDHSNVVNNRIGPYPVLLYADPVRRNVRAYLRQVNERVLTFSLAESGDQLIDAETGSTWHASRGSAHQGEYQGQVLLPLPYLSSFDWAWLDFHPDSEFYR